MINRGSILSYLLLFFVPLRWTLEVRNLRPHARPRLCVR